MECPLRIQVQIWLDEQWDYKHDNDIYHFFFLIGDSKKTDFKKMEEETYVFFLLPKVWLYTSYTLLHFLLKLSFDLSDYGDDD